MTTFRFDKREHTEYGHDGWLLEGSPSTYEPLSGMAVAHDLLEHKRDDDGSIEDEFMALGAMIHIRGEGGYWPMYHPMQHAQSPGENMPGDLVRLWTGAESFEGACYAGTRDPGRTTRLDDEWCEEQITIGLREAKRELVDEYDCDAREIDTFLAHARGWMRKGYRHARRRYKRCCPAELAHVFHTIEREADRLLKLADFEQLVVRFTKCRCDVSVSLEYPKDPYGY